MAEHFDAELEELERASDRPTYNTAAVEQRTGLRPATFRAWERRYGFPRPRRLPGNQRLYSDRDIAALRWLKRRTAEGLGISHAIRLLRDLPERVAPPVVQPVTGRPFAALAAELQRALLAFDARRADALLRESFGLYSIEETCLQVIQPSLIEIGEGWHRGEVSVADEHFATTYVRRKLFALLDAYQPDVGRGSILTACAPEEWHEVGILMISLFLVRRGFRVSYLGPSLAADGLTRTLRRHRPDLLCLSVMPEETAAGLDRVMEVVEGLPPPRPRIAYGGQGFADPDRRQPLRATYLGPDAASAVQTVEQLLSETDR